MNETEIQDELDQWSGAIACVVSYTQSHSQLQIELKRPRIKKNIYLICEDCQTMRFPAVWGDADLRISHQEHTSDSGCVSVKDKAADVEIVCNGLRVLHDVEPMY